MAVAEFQVGQVDRVGRAEGRDGDAVQVGGGVLESDAGESGGAQDIGAAEAGQNLVGGGRIQGVETDRAQDQPGLHRGAADGSQGDDAVAEGIQAQVELAAGVVSGECDAADLPAALGQDQRGAVEGGLGVAQACGEGGLAGGDPDDVPGGEAADGPGGKRGQFQRSVRAAEADRRAVGDPECQQAVFG